MRYKLVAVTSESQTLSTPPILRISVVVHPVEYCHSVPPIRSSLRVPVTIGLPYDPDNDEVSHGEKDQGRGGSETKVGKQSVIERDRPYRPPLRRPGRAGRRRAPGSMSSHGA